jgi:ribosome-associated protein
MGSKTKKHAYFYSTIAGGGEFLALKQTTPRTKTVRKTATKKTAATKTPAKKAEIPTWLVAVRAAEDKKAQDIKVLDLTGVSSFTDFFVICTGTSSKQTQAISDEVAFQMKKRGELPLSVEGYSQGEWILTDYGDVVIHTLTQKARSYYDLERLWREGKPVEIPTETPKRTRRPKQDSNAASVD